MYKKHRVHFIGIGGIGMSGIAEVLRNLGYPVSGSDLKRSAVTTRLKRKGAKIFIGHRAKNIQACDIVVYSSAVRPDNPEMQEAAKQGLCVIPRALMLAEIMRLTKYPIAVAGSHGKTTTTSLLGHVLHASGLDPTLVIGGRVNSMRTNARLGKGDFMVAEADESDGSFLHLLPAIAVVTNIDPEHMDHYKTFDVLKKAFVEFCNKVPFYGLVVLCGEHNITREMAAILDRRVSLYGFSDKHDWNAQNLSFSGTTSSFDLYQKDTLVGHVTLNLAGAHNVLNALAAIAVANELGISFPKIFKALKEFKGVGRRLEILLKTPDLTIIDDYGHHPTEIQATLKAVRKAFAGRLVVLFQPHRYSRTQDLFDDFVKSFELADLLLVTDIYAASEASIPGVNSKALVKAIGAHKGDHVHYIAKSKDMATHVSALLQKDDIFLSLGAGDVTKMGREIAKIARKKVF